LGTAETLNGEQTPIPARRLGKGQGAAIALKVAITAGCFWYLSRQIDFTALRLALASLNFGWAALAVALLATQIPLVAFRWTEILSVLRLNDARWTFSCTLAVTAIGQFVSQILPTAVGDGIRVFFLSRYSGRWHDATVSVVIDRGLGVGLLVAFGFVILLLPSQIDMPGAYREMVIAMLGALLLAGIIALEIGSRLAPRLAGWKYGHFLADLFVVTRRVLLSGHGAKVICAGSLIHVLTIIAVWSLGQALDLPFAPSDAAILFVLMTGVVLIPISIGGWGTREFAVVSLLRHYGVAPEHALIFSMSFGLACVAASLPGAIVWFVFTPPRADSRLGSRS